MVFHIEEKRIQKVTLKMHDITVDKVIGRLYVQSVDLDGGTASPVMRQGGGRSARDRPTSVLSVNRAGRGGSSIYTK